jgi:large subunit ribosomal protein L15
MASKTTSRLLQGIIRRARPTCECASSTYPRTASIRQFSSSGPRADVQYETNKAERPRWSYTPEKMKAPFPWRVRDTEKKWECNNDPARLDQFYKTFLGPGGDKVLTEEIKWLAITHKSFDQGRRGFNDRLAFFGIVLCLIPLPSHADQYITGRRILNLQTHLALLQSPTAKKTQSLPDPSDDRIPFTHPALKSLANLSNVPLGEILTKQRLSGLATQMGMREIMRWVPKRVSYVWGN